MAVTQNLYTGDGLTVLFSFTFPYLETSDIKVSVDGTNTTAYTLANATTIQFNTAPANGAAIRIYRQTDDSDLSATFYPGSAIRSQDLNDNFTQNLYVTQENNNYGLKTDGSNPMVGDLDLDGNKILNLATPTSSTDASTKGYVDSVVATGAANAAAAAASAAAAAGSATAAANTLDSFDDRYLGAKTTDPTVDNDGNTLLVGAIYFNSTSKVMRVWNGANWQDSSANANVLRWRKTAVGGETTLSGNDDSGQSLTYTVNLEAVFLNGALLQRGVDYVATTGNSITGLVALTAGDVVEVLAFSQVSLLAIPSNTVTFTQSGTGAVERTLESKLKDVVSVKDFGAVEGADNANATTNTAAFIAALKTNKTVFVPRGEYRINQIDCTANSIGTVDIIGEFSTIKRVGGGATFYISALGCNLKLERVNLSGNGTGSSVHYDYPTATGKQVFRHCSFLSDQYGLNVEALAVGWVVEDCTFNGLNNTAQYFAGGAWACRFENNYTWYCNKGFYTNSGHGTAYRASVFEYNSSEAVIIENNGPAGNDITDFVFDSIFFESNAKDNAVPITRVETTFAARIRNIAFRNCYYTIPAQATYYCEITPGAGGSISNVLFDTCTFNAGATLAPTNTNSNRVNFLNCYFNDGIAATAIRSANKKYVPINGNESPVVSVSGTATVSEVQTNKLSIPQASGSAIEMRARSGASAVMYSNVSLLCIVNNGTNTAALDLPEMLSGSSVASDQRVYLVTVLVKDSDVNSSSYTRIITMFGGLTTGINVTALSTVNVGTAANLTFTRTDPGGGAPHQLTISGNNVARIKSVNAILLGRH